jgi:circadian clock protein KaiC
MKMRGQASIPGLHTFRITGQGLQVFPRLIVEAPEVPPAEGGARQTRPQLSTGVTDLDALLGGGVPAGHSVLVAGPSGSGKTVLATQFLLEGVRRGEPGVVAVFEKRPSEFAQVGLVEQAVRDGLIEILQTRPLDLSIDETVHELREAIGRLGARRVVIDSLSGFELALAPTFREEFRESLYRMVTVLTTMDVTVLMTAELADSYTDLRFSPHGTAFLTDAIILQRYVEIDGQLRRALAVVKVRGSDHSKDLHLFDVTGEGLAIGPPIGRSRGLLSGRPHLAPPGPRRGRRLETSPRGA